MRSALITLALAPLIAFAQHDAPAPATGTEQHLVHWVSIEEAQTAAKVDGKPIIMDMWTPWCGWCKRMDAATFNDPQTAEYINTNFHAVSFNAEGKDPVTFNGTVLENKEFNPAGGMRNGTHDLTKAVAVVNGGVGYPTIVYIASDGALIGPDQGYKSPEDIEILLRYVREGSYKTIALEEYKKTFVSQRKKP
jgi:thioredoxin-related protein